MCVPTLTNWIKHTVDRKGSASVRLTYEEDWHRGWSWQRVGGVRGGGEQMCVSTQAWNHAEGEEALLTLMDINKQIHTYTEEKGKDFACV